MNVELAANHTTNTTPCVRNCCLNENQICLGCGRSLPEILEWHHADSNRQNTICLNAKNRLAHQQ